MRVKGGRGLGAVGGEWDEGWGWKREEEGRGTKR